MIEDYLYWIWINGLKGIGPQIARKLINKFILPENVYNATEEEIKAVPGIGDCLCDNIIKSKILDEPKKIIEKCKKHNIKIVTYKEGKFPLDIDKDKDNNMPVLLYYLGNLQNNLQGVAIVGARRCSDYGKQVTIEAAQFLAKNNIPVISGMAKGIDSYAHTACIKSGGYTIAYLGCGVDICYPREHKELMYNIIKTGAVVSEYPPGTKVSRENFPKRNRLISASSKKILIAEASENSGSLITAKYAAEQNKEIFAVPNNIYSKESKGTNDLIAKGVKIYLTPKQLLIKNTEEIPATDKSNSELTLLMDEEKTILNFIRRKAVTMDEICVLLRKDKLDIINTLCSMEIEGKIKCVGGRYLA